MEQYIAFFFHHWGLGLLLAMVILAIIIYESWSGTVGPKQLSAEKVVEIINHENGVVIDLRDKESFKQGHIINAVNLPASDLSTQTKVLEKCHQKPVILIAAQPARLSSTLKFLQQQNFTKIHILRNGMRAWIDANLPVEK